MTGEQVVRVVRAVGRCLTALADDLEQITAEPAVAEEACPLDDIDWSKAPGSTVWT